MRASSRWVVARRSGSVADLTSLSSCTQSTKSRGGRVSTSRQSSKTFTSSYVSDEARAKVRNGTGSRGRSVPFAEEPSSPRRFPSFALITRVCSCFRVCIFFASVQVWPPAFRLSAPFPSLFPSKIRMARPPRRRNSRAEEEAELFDLDLPSSDEEAIVEGGATPSSRQSTRRDTRRSSRSVS